MEHGRPLLGHEAVAGEVVVIAADSCWYGRQIIDRTYFAAGQAGEGQRREVDDGKVREGLVQIAPVAERRHATDAYDAIELAAREHPLVEDDLPGESALFAQTGERLGIH